jgi:hypothetical protein
MDDVGPESFSPQPGGWFRLVTVAGSQIRCPEPVEFTGRFKDWKDDWHEVEACLGHAEDLTDWRRVNANIVDISKARKIPPFRGPYSPGA